MPISKNVKNVYNYTFYLSIKYNEYKYNYRLSRGKVAACFGFRGR